MISFFRSGYYEYDKRKLPKQRRCEGCGTFIPARKRFCGPCYDARLEAGAPARRAKYEAKKRSEGAPR